MSNYPDGVTHRDVLAEDWTPVCSECDREILDFDEEDHRMEGGSVYCVKCMVREWRHRAIMAERELARLKKSSLEVKQ